MIALKELVLTGGIGRELYTSPFIWVKWEDLEVSTDGKVKSTFWVEKIKIENKKITVLSIKNNKDKRVFVYTETKLPEEKK